MDWQKFGHDVRRAFRRYEITEDFITLCFLYERLHLLKINPDDYRPVRRPGSGKLLKRQIAAIKKDTRKLRQIAWEYKISIALVHRIQNA